MPITNPLQELWRFRQSPWYDNLSRRMIASGELSRMIREDGLRGITSNPTIFDKAISGSRDYDATIEDLVERGESDPRKIFERLAIEDVQRACDLLRPLFDAGGGADGFVSLEVAPTLAHDAAGTVREAERLFSLVSRPNVMIKVPATLEGIPAVEELIGEGVHINVTLIFSNDRYEAAANAYIRGLERLARSGKPLGSVSSVASFFVSRIDAAVDTELQRRLSDQKKSGGNAPYHLFLGRVAIANAKAAYKRFQTLFSTPRFRELLRGGARVQRVLWASTGAKNSQYRDVVYVEELIGSDTVNTIPPATWNAFRDHGKLRASLEEGLQDAQDVLANLRKIGVSLDQITEKLEKEGVKAFEDSYDSLLKSIASKADQFARRREDAASAFTDPFRNSIQKTLDELIKDKIPQRLYQRDPSIWSTEASDIAVIKNSLGWLDLPVSMEPKIAEIESFVQEARKDGFSHALLLGMGGSSLAPEVLRRTFEPRKDFLKLSVLDSTDPEAVSEMDRLCPPEKTLYIVSSKSGTTTEPLRFFDYYYARVQERKRDKAGAHFAAITDPGSYLEKVGRERSFRAIFANPSDIGGRYSALSLFGLVPAGLLGMDLRALLARAGDMARACASDAATENPALRLASAIGSPARTGRDKVTLLVSPELSGLDLWLEQLLAESLGKKGKGIVPLSGEPLSDPAKYGRDRIFVHIRLNGSKSHALEVFAPDLQRAGHPVIELVLQDRLDLGAEFYRWEAATAVLGHLLGVNAFDQPNVQEAKNRTHHLLTRLSEQGSLPSVQNLAEDRGAENSGMAIAFSKAARTDIPADGDLSVEKALRLLIRGLKAGDYLGLLAYVSPAGKYDEALKNLQGYLFLSAGVPVQFGYGPRYLHSTGQLHKGGPDSGVFIILVREDQPDLKIPGAAYGFGPLIYAQCLGDFQALDDAGRRAALIRMRGDPLEAVARLSKIIAPRASAAI